MIASLLAELSGRAGLQVPSAPLPWLHSVLEQIEDEFCRPHSLESLAETAGVHPVHLAREFHRRFGCTVGHYIRQRRIERSEEHTSELQSLMRISYAVFSLKKKKHNTNNARHLQHTPQKRTIILPVK